MERQPDQEHCELLIVYHPEFAAQGYPALRERVEPAFDELQSRGLLQLPQVRVREPVPAQEELVERVHADSHMRSVATSGYYEVAMLSAGSVVLGAAEVAASRASNAFCFVGAAGHHASRDGFWGFCYLNDVAIAIAGLRETSDLERFAILDIDPHFGDGTRDILGSDPDVLHLNFHSGHPIGREEGANNIDFALAYDASNDRFLAQVDKAIAAALDFSPELLFVIFGHDSHRDDYGGFALGDGAYRAFAEKVRAAFPRKVCYVLSGGSNPRVARRAIGDVIQVLAGTSIYGNP